ncbi:MAG: glycosyltransferase family protein [Kiritimatiellae bacterium]|nr:glycosyltransferase family protein [Kiritimatiellia bacterium]
MRYVAIIQARLSSERLPGKVLLDVAGKTLLARVVERVQRAARLDEVVVATSSNASDDAIALECGRLNCPVYRGSEEDVLMRIIEAAEVHAADAVVRITADCPLIDSGIIDDMISLFSETQPDYASNVLIGCRKFPRGLDTEVVSLDALRRVEGLVSDMASRSHVTLYIREHSDAFATASFEQDEDLSDWRWTVDEHEDLVFVRAIYDAFRDTPAFGWREVHDLLLANEDLIRINERVRQKTLDEV